MLDVFGENIATVSPLPLLLLSKSLLGFLPIKACSQTLTNDYNSPKESSGVSIEDW